jgi:hypothetical protein
VSLLLDLREADPNLHGAIFNQEGELRWAPLPFHHPPRLYCEIRNPNW